MIDIIIWFLEILLYVLLPFSMVIIVTIGTIKIIKNILKSRDSKVVKLLAIITIFVIDIFIFVLMQEELDCIYYGKEWL